MIWIMSDIWIDAFAAASECVLPAGSALFHRGDPVRNLFLVREGRVVLRRALEDGGLLDLHSAGPGDVVALGSLFSETTHCDAVCETEVRVASRPVGAVHAWLGASPAAAVLEVQGLRARVEVLRLRRLSDRLDAYLDLHGAPDPGGWVGIADWIGVSPPALYWELGRRRAA